jgi:protein AroM
MKREISKTGVGLITIGQSPRDDVVGEMRSILGTKIKVAQRGALDGLGSVEIAKLKPGKNDFPLITRLRDGSSVVVGEKAILPLLQKRVGELEKSGVTAIGLLCTDEFVELKSGGLLLRPYYILMHAVAAVVESGTLGVFVPLPEQRRDARAKWERTGLNVVIEALNPYQESNEASRVVERVRGEKPDREDQRGDRQTRASAADRIGQDDL